MKKMISLCLLLFLVACSTIVIPSQNTIADKKLQNDIKKGISLHEGHANPSKISISNITQLPKIGNSYIEIWYLKGSDKSYTVKMTPSKSGGVELDISNNIKK
ncbi:MAG: hypothetical protein COA79_22745 [Planctomycetota bacterium]|nr:MAG: hypothetical protein COA79_22745 [Planctomycetota bacterium]